MQPGPQEKEGPLLPGLLPGNDRAVMVKVRTLVDEKNTPESAGEMFVSYAGHEEELLKKMETKHQAETPHEGEGRTQ